jgi:hypothetical protein
MTVRCHSIALAVSLMLASVMAIAPHAYAHDDYDSCIEEVGDPGYCDGMYPPGSPGGQTKIPDGEPFVIKTHPIRLFQPPDDTTTTLNPRPGIDTFFEYFNLAWPWVLGSAAGIAVLQALVGGIQIMLSGSDSGARESGKSRLMWALAGLLMIGLSGMILETLNPLFYNQI